jgi:hypothetical protein
MAAELCGRKQPAGTWNAGRDEAFVMNVQEQEKYCLRQLFMVLLMYHF